MSWFPLVVITQRQSRSEGDTRPVLLGSTVAEEAAVFAVGDVTVLVADPGTDGAAAHPLHHGAGVAVVPVLGHEHPRCLDVGAQLSV